MGKKKVEKVVKYNRIKDVLEEKQLSQYALAKELGVTYMTVTRYANNLRQPALETMFDIAKILKCKVSDLINE